MELEKEPEKILHIGKITKCRIKEVAALKNEIEQTRTSGLAVQMVPRHMRRRAASRKPSRLPRRLRHLFQKQKLASGSSKIVKSRRKQRQSKHLMRSFSKRQKSGTWLETHMWHAKRFMIKSMWGYKIPVHPNDKSFRALHRASKDYCMLHDISYYCCIEIAGNVEQIILKLNCLLRPMSTLTFGGKMFLDGMREGNFVIYRPSCYPREVIGPVKFIWQATESVVKNIWLWIHPSSYEELKRNIIELFEVECEDHPPLASSVQKNCDEDPMLAKGITYRNKNFVINFLKDCLNRFRLTGPLAMNLLSSILVPIKESDVPKNTILASAFAPSTKDTIELQRLHWEAICHICEPALLSSHSIISLSVLLPELKVPARRKLCNIKQSRHQDTSSALSQSRQPGECQSPLWMEDIRKQVSSGKPGFNTWAPIIIVQNPGSRLNGLGHGAGLDIIMPSGVAMKFWLPLFYNGARIGGLRDLEQLAFEQEEPFYPALFPDSKAGRELEDQVRQNKEENYNRQARQFPDKKSGQEVCCFKLQWSELMSSDSSRDYFIVRNEGVLKNLRSLLRLTSPSSRNKVISGLRSVEEFNGGLVSVVVVATGKGSIAWRTMLCLPKGNDLLKQDMDKTCVGDRQIVGYVCKGDFSFTVGASKGIGFCSFKGLLDWLETSEHSNLLLFREVGGTIYRWCSIKIL